jgi:peptide subunit release factor 1 (eRF1)
LTALLSDDSKFGFIVIDGSGALFGTLQGNTREVLHKFTVDLPKKHGTAHHHHTDMLSAISAVHRAL